MPDASGVRVKICGLTRAGDVEAAVSAGAAYVGFVFYPPSPRYLELDTARALATAVRPGVCKVALTVDASDETLDALLAQVPIDMLQLQGHEPPERVTELRARFGLPVMKAIGVATAADLAEIDRYAAVADQLLIDAKPPPGSDLPGGNGLPFDWTLLAGRRWTVPWLLAGGLTPLNVGRAISHTHARQVDVSSSVESSRGVKDPERIKAFVAGAKAVPASMPQVTV